MSHLVKLILDSNLYMPNFLKPYPDIVQLYAKRILAIFYNEIDYMSMRINGIPAPVYLDYLLEILWNPSGPPAVVTMTDYKHFYYALEQDCHNVSWLPLF